MSSPDEEVVAQVMSAAEPVEALDDECRLLLLSVLTEDDELQVELTGSTVRRASGRAPRPPVKEPAGAYLKSVTVAGFRGIGPESRLDLHPAPSSAPSEIEGYFLSQRRAALQIAQLWGLIEDRGLWHVVPQYSALASRKK